jgi:hypothetical protein
MKHSLLLIAPAPLVIVSRPSVTVTVALPAIHRLVDVTRALTVSVSSTLIRNTLS